MDCKGSRLELFSVELFRVIMLEVIIDCEENAVRAEGADLAE